MTQGVGTPFERGRGTILTIVGTDPAVNVEIVETVPAGVIWRLILMGFNLVTDANAANRNVRILLDDGANVFLTSGANITQLASLNRGYNVGAFGMVGPLTTVSTLQFAIPIPPNIVLPAGYRISTSTSGLQAGDNFSTPILLVEEWSL